MGRHIHIHVNADNDLCEDDGDEPTLTVGETLIIKMLDDQDERLARVEQQMSDNQAAITNLVTEVGAMNDRVVADVEHLRDLLSQKDELLEAALATKAEDTTTIDALRAENEGLKTEAESTFASIGDVTARIANIDPDTSFPATA